MAKKTTKKTSAPKAAKTAKKVSGKSAAKAAKKASPVKKTAKKVATKAAKKASGKAQPAPRAKAPGAASRPAGTSEARDKRARAVQDVIKRKVAPGKRKAEEDAKKAGPGVFTFEDAMTYLQERKARGERESVGADTSMEGIRKARAAARAAGNEEPSARPAQSFGAASVADILGFNPLERAQASQADLEEEGVPKKWLPYFRSLWKLRQEVYEGIDRHSKETLLRTARDGSGDLSGYGQHMADAGTESFERDFALSMVTSEQDLLYEIDEAIDRIRNGTFGVCEITGKPIKADRLRAVPFTRYSVEGQAQMERSRQRTVQRGGIFDSSEDDAALFADDEVEE